MPKVTTIPPRKQRNHPVTSQETQKIRVAAYCRVSTDTEEQATSYQAQIAHYEEGIHRNPEWVFAGIYADDGISATSTKHREQFHQMIQDCIDGKIDMLITKSISRFARNTVDCLNYIRQLKAQNIPIYFEKESINTMDAKGEVLITIMASLAQQESESLSQNVKLGMQYRFQQGKVMVNASCFLGYDKDENGDLVINPEQAETVKRIYREYLEGASCQQIARGLERDGIQTARGNTRWHDSSIRLILENEKYRGRNGYPAIIGENMFCRANMRKKIKSTTVVEISEELQAIRSLTYCAECGHRISRIGGNTHSEKWDCRNPECSRFSHRITDQMLIGIIVAVLNTVIANPNLLDADAEISRYTPSIEITRQQNEISRLMETPDVDFESAKEEICKLAELKYDCCTYSNKPQKTTQLREVLASHEQLNTLDIGLPQSCISRILVSHFCTVEIEFINGVVIKNIIERKMQNDHSAQCQGNSCKAANYGKQG